MWLPQVLPPHCGLRCGHAQAHALENAETEYLPLQVCCEPARTKVRLSIHMNLIWVLIKMCFSWLLPVEELRISRTFAVSLMNPMAVFAMPVRLQLARIHPPPARRHR